MKRVGILFGGKSAEHEISLLSARNIYEAIDRTQFEPVLVGIDKNGHWLINDASRFLLNDDNPALISLNAKGKPVALQPEKRGLLSGSSAGTADRFDPVSLDAVFPILHGPFG